MRCTCGNLLKNDTEVILDMCIECSTYLNEDRQIRKAEIESNDGDLDSED